VAVAAERYFQLKLVVDATPRSIVIRFSPWLIAGRAELAQALFSEMARALGAALGKDVKRAFADVLKRLSEFAPIVGAAIDVTTAGSVGRLITVGSSWSGKVATAMASDRTLDDLRERLRAVLRELDDRRVLVVVDDLDRLMPAEALVMVSLIKSLGDLPNVIYLLSYEEEKLTQLLDIAIKPNGGEYGSEYLEKIVQYPVHLPLIEGDDLARLLNADLNSLLGDISEEESQRLEEAWYYTFQHYLKTPRDVRRFVNAASVAVSGLEDYADRVDQLILILLQLYEPRIYQWIRRSLHNLTE
jgi:predicted KAP-like P-loop ATPase